MDNQSENQFFLLIKKNKILFTAFDQKKGSIFTKEKLIEYNSIDKIYYLLENFLKQNILEIEKDLKNFIKKIYIIFENDSFFLAESSIKLNLKKTNLSHNQIKESLIDIRNQFQKHSPGYEIIHMIISRYIINGITHKNLPENINCENLVIQVNFICLEDQIVEKFKKIFSEYQISINKVLSYEYLKKLNNFDKKDIIKVANDNINGLNVNEVFVVRKIGKNQGFFEKFFNFFN